MTHLHRPLGIAFVSAMVAACGSNRMVTEPMHQAPTTTLVGHAPTSAPTIARTYTQHTDLDGDSDNNNDDYGWGQPAHASDVHSAMALVKHYYAAGADGNGSRACALIYRLVAEEVVEHYDERIGTSALHGKSCAEVMSKMFVQQHKQLKIDHATVKVRAMRVNGARALVIMSFANQPQRDILVHRESRGWRIQELLDTRLG